MPPRPKPILKKSAGTAAPAPPPAATTVAKQISRIRQDDAQKSMPPPPTPQAILEPEITAMQTCLKNAVVKTGEIYKFYSDTRRLGIQRYAPRPPQSVTSSLGREIENYDQYCDAIETHLRNAIAVLHRDLANQEAKARQAEEEARAKAAPPAEAASGDDSSMPPPPNLPSYDRETMSPSIGRTPNRRQSVISMSALQRPTAKHPELKLDLSATSLRLTAEEAASMFSVSSGLASPVTLAPRSARPLGPDEFDADMMVAMASANSDGGHQDALNLAGFSDASGPVGASGSSADQPIELDLDAIDASLDMDLFGDGPESGSGVGDSLFSPAPSMDKIKMEDTDEALFSDDLFGTIPEASTSGGGTIQDGPSPGTLLASFGPENAQDSQAPLDLGQFSFDGDLGMGMDMGGSDLSGVDPLLGLPEISNVDFMGMTTDNSGGQ